MGDGGVDGPTNDKLVLEPFSLIRLVVLAGHCTSSPVLHPTQLFLLLLIFCNASRFLFTPLFSRNFSSHRKSVMTAVLVLICRISFVFPYYVLAVFVLEGRFIAHYSVQVNK